MATPATARGHRPVDTPSGAKAPFAACACFAARREASDNDRPGLSKRGDARELRRAPAAASNGCVTVASKARFRAERQSGHSFAPATGVPPQI
jgi:hypothetical protein